MARSLGVVPSAIPAGLACGPRRFHVLVRVVTAPEEMWTRAGGIERGMPPNEVALDRRARPRDPPGAFDVPGGARARTLRPFALWRTCGEEVAAPPRQASSAGPRASSRPCRPADAAGSRMPPGSKSPCLMGLRSVFRGDSRGFRSFSNASRSWEAVPARVSGRGADRPRAVDKRPKAADQRTNFSRQMPTSPVKGHSGQNTRTARPTMS